MGANRLIKISKKLPHFKGFSHRFNVYNVIADITQDVPGNEAQSICFYFTYSDFNMDLNSSLISKRRLGIICV